MLLSPGTRLGPYDLQSRLGGGGMGEVWKAYDAKLQRTVAIKVLHDTADAASRILAEARAASALNHPHICTIHDVGDADGQSFIVMEYVEGKPLSEVIPSDGLAPERVIRYGSQIADGLAHAHQHAIVHRDIKSANVVITPDGRAKVLDFGVADKLSPVEAAAVTTTHTLAAPVGRIAGTLAYMAPEQLRGEAATCRSDVWGLGVLLYEMASGHVPFTAASGTEVAANILKDTAPALPDRVSANLRSIIERCLSKEPGRRYSSGEAVHSALEAISSDGARLPTPGTPPASPRPVKPRWTLAVAAALLVAALGASWAYWGRGSGEPTGTASAVPRLVNPRQITSALGVEGRLTWAPDGQRIAYESEQRGNGDIWVAQVGGQPPVNLTADHAGLDVRPSWSPDGTQIAFVSDRDGLGYYTMSALGGPAQKVMSASVANVPHRPQWSADGGALAGIVTGDDGNAAIEIVTLSSRESRRVQLPGSNFGFDPSWSPSGRFFALVEAPAYDADVNRLYLVRVSDGKAIPITDGRTAVWSPSWSRDERTLYFVTNRGGSMDLWQQPMTVEGVSSGAAEAVTTGVGIRNATMSPDGSTLAYSRGSRVANVWRVPILPNREATWADAEQVTFDQAFVEFIDVSAEGQQIAVSSDRTGNQDLWVMPAAGGAMRQLTAEPTPDWSPRFSPDGSSVAFYSYRSGNRDIWRVPTAGGLARQMTRHPGYDGHLTWSPDGEEIAFMSDRAGNFDIWALSVAGGEPRQLTTSTAFDGVPYWSPDGKWIGFLSTRSGTGSIWRIPAEGGPAERLTADQSQISIVGWSPDAEAIHVIDEAGLRAVTVADRRPRSTMSFRGRHGNLVLTGASAVSRDGRFVYFIWREDQGDIWLMDVVRGGK
jgi:eukaryotic-like serine/threonine-protein kinase